jgi:mannose-6-phosphate isomerase
VQRIYSLKGKVQHYSWGGYQFIPQLLNINNEKNIPFAEYWLGAHPIFSSTINHAGKEIPLDEFIEQNKELVLGSSTLNEYGGLPFLLKVLDVRQMLSIQVHPSKKEAAIGYANENIAGVPLTSPQRNYKDDNHKPEAMVALSDFYLLHGFKPEPALKNILSQTTELNFLQDVYHNEGYKGLYQHVMLLQQEEVNNKLQKLAERILPLYNNGSLKKESEDFWAARAILSFCKNDHYDKGIFSIYFFNLLHLKKGEGVYQQEGMPHAYLEGQNMEIMANSDNVLRGGLTDKHIDIPELMKHTNFEATVPNILCVNNDYSYSTPAREFIIYKYELANSENAIETRGPEVIFCVDGHIVLKASGEKLLLSKGEAAFLIANVHVEVQSAGDSVFFRAAVPGV